VLGLVYLLRFFWLVSVLPTLMIGGFIVTAAVACVAVGIDPSLTANALVPVLMLHMFASSSGFAGGARRGYYDLVLTSGDTRLRIALAHWALSVAPGLMGWGAVAMVEVLVSRGMNATSMASGTIVAFGIVSMLAWAVNVALPRFTAGIAWLVLCGLVVVCQNAAARLVLFPPLPDPWEVTMSPAFALLCPWTLVGRTLTLREMVLTAPAILIAVGGIIAAGAWICTAEVPLEAAQ
jgi:hypothetical protein